MITEQLSPSQLKDMDYETEHAQRQRVLDYNDPVHTIALKDTFQSQVRIFHKFFLLKFVVQILKTLLTSLVDHAAKYSRRKSIRPTDAHPHPGNRRNTQGLHIAVRKEQDQNKMQDSTNALHTKKSFTALQCKTVLFYCIILPSVSLY